MDTVGDGLPLLFLGFIIIITFFLLILLCFFYLSTFIFFLLGLYQGLLFRILNMKGLLTQIFIFPLEYDRLLLADATHGLFKGLSLLSTGCLLRLLTLSPISAP